MYQLKNKKTYGLLISLFFVFIFNVGINHTEAARDLNIPDTISGLEVLDKEPISGYNGHAESRFIRVRDPEGLNRETYLEVADSNDGNLVRVLDNHLHTLRSARVGILRRRRYYVDKSYVYNQEEQILHSEYDAPDEVPPSYLERIGSGFAEGAAEGANNVASSVKSSIDCLTGAGPLVCAMSTLSYHTIMVPTAGMLSLSGKMFDFILNVTIIDMGRYLFPSGEDSVINIGWTLVRDLVNMLFIFVLLYISINTIISGYSSAGKKLGTVIAVALFINFSLFFTKIFIDFSNTLAISFYQSIVAENDGGSSGGVNAGISELLGQENSISQVFISKTGVGSIYGGIKDDDFVGEDGDGKGIDHLFVLRQAIMGSVLMFLVAIVLFISSFMLIGRFITLIFIMITSSLAVGSLLLPNLKKSIFDKWFSALVGQAMFAPAFLLMLYISIIFIVKTPGLTSAYDIRKFEDLAGVGVQAAVSYIIIIGLIIGSIIIASKVASSSGSGANSITSKLGGKSMNMVAAANRRTVGAAAQRVSESRFAKGNNVFSRGLRAASNKTATSTMDLRNISGGDKVGLGKGGGKGGYRKTQADAVKKFESDLKDVSAPTRGQVKNSAKYAQVMEGETKKPNSLIHNVSSSEAKIKDLQKKLKDEKDTSARRNLTRQLENANSELKSAQAAFVQSLNPEQAKVVSQQQSNKEKSKKRGKNYMKRGKMDIHKMTPTYARFRDNQRSQKLKEKGQNDDLIAALEKSKGSGDKKDS